MEMLLTARPRPPFRDDSDEISMIIYEIKLKFTISRYGNELNFPHMRCF